MPLFQTKSNVLSCYFQVRQKKIRFSLKIFWNTVKSPDVQQRATGTTIEKIVIQVQLLPPLQKPVKRWRAGGVRRHNWVKIFLKEYFLYFFEKDELLYCLCYFSLHRFCLTRNIIPSAGNLYTGYHMIFYGPVDYLKYNMFLSSIQSSIWCL